MQLRVCSSCTAIELFGRAEIDSTGAELPTQWLDIPDSDLYVEQSLVTVAGHPGLRPLCRAVTRDSGWSFGVAEGRVYIMLFEHDDSLHSARRHIFKTAGSSAIVE